MKHARSVGGAFLNPWGLPMGDTQAACLLKVVFKSGRGFGLFRSERTRGIETNFLQLVFCCSVQAVFSLCSRASGPRVTGSIAVGLASRSKLIQFPPWEKYKWCTKCKGSTSHDILFPRYPMSKHHLDSQFWNHVIPSFQKNVLLCTNKLTYAFFQVSFSCQIDTEQNYLMASQLGDCFDLIDLWAHIKAFSWLLIDVGRSPLCVVPSGDRVVV